MTLLVLIKINLTKVQILDIFMFGLTEEENFAIPACEQVLLAVALFAYASKCDNCWASKRTIAVEDVRPLVVILPERNDRVCATFNDIFLFSVLSQDLAICWLKQLLLGIFLISLFFCFFLFLSFCIVSSRIQLLN